MQFRLRWLAVLVVILLAFVALALRSCDYFTVDACLDSGGKWNIDTKSCER